MDCKRVYEVMYMFIDDEMDDELVPTFRSHVDGCPPCARRMDFTRRLLLTVRERCVRHSAPERLRSRILVSLERQGEILH